ncbi:hypothetical protein O7627_16960 [Solwaraspora sp. WMMD1047]|uniref:hypothetical protein n=1 Tax=Solwaraspora sp. WMMD1047 TaxID=3016102 RepID=UPI002417FAF4|nr:hypothetical protein [Solwaraspora sp. WMMD1047]MDG4830984.1 hypothetical protein [Solwaraspora sp. WMMD1047]
MAHSEVLAVGPRSLPEHGTVEVRVDAGSGATGQTITVPVGDLRIAELDNGKGSSALYALRIQ